MTTTKLCSDCIHYHVPASKEPCRDCLPQTVAVPNFKRKPSGWIEWNGGECPVSPNTLVSARLADGYETRAYTACSFNWHHNVRGHDDIVAYKVEQ